MSAPLWITCQREDDIPSLADLQHLVTDAQHVVLRLPVTSAASDFESDKQRLIQQLASHLPQFSVFDSGSKDAYSWITIKKVITAQAVLNNAAAIVEAVRQFRRTAQQLIHRLADTLDLSTDAFAARYIRFQLPQEAQEGKLDDDWTYWFHGGECQFKNTSTGQVLDICLGFHNEFGVLDPFFFYRFLTTTPELVSVASLFQDGYHDTQRALEILEQHGYLKRVVMQNSSATGLTLVTA